jgi:Zn ribbon nucleic-acid-binding protein
VICPKCSSDITKVIIETKNLSYENCLECGWSSRPTKCPSKSTRDEMNDFYRRSFAKSVAFKLVQDSIWR